MHKSSITGAILTGGKSSRLGRDKAFETINGCRLIDRVILLVARVSETILIITSKQKISQYTNLNHKVIADIYPNRGVLGAIYTGLVHSDTRYTLFVGCDMPLLNIPLLKHMIGSANKNSFDIIVPELNGMVEPLHAIYSKTCLPAILLLLEQKKLKVADLFHIVDTKYICQDEIEQFDKNHLSFLNLNTQDDIEKANSLISQNICDTTQAVIRGFF